MLAVAHSHPPTPLLFPPSVADNSSCTPAFAVMWCCHQAVVVLWRRQWHASRTAVSLCGVHAGPTQQMAHVAKVGKGALGEAVWLPEH